MKIMTLLKMNCIRILLYYLTIYKWCLIFILNLLCWVEASSFFVLSLHLLLLNRKENCFCCCRWLFYKRFSFFFCFFFCICWDMFSILRLNLRFKWMREKFSLITQKEVTQENHSKYRFNRLFIFLTNKQTDGRSIYNRK